MYDNISLYLDSRDANNINLYDEVLENSNNITIERYGLKLNDVPFAYISIEGKNNQKLSFKVEPYRISMMGKNSSICKYYLGNNFETLTLMQFNNAIDEISERLGVCLNNARVCRIDIANNFLMEYKPSTYHECLKHLSRYKRYAINGNLYFKTKRIELNFYDKKKEYKEKGFKIPTKHLNTENILRYEIRFKKDVAKIFDRTIRVTDLRTESFLKEVFDKWQSYYWNIKKQNPVIFESENRTFTAKDFKDYFFTKGVEAIGGIEYAYKMIDESKNADNFTRQKAYYLKQVLNNAYDNANNTSNYDFTGELNSKMQSMLIPLK
ncbi:hypothetical protein SAMN04515667_0903 [Formosa sp. Hel1_31_208]|uniref:phage/plasmid replication domain-containing protein n=1 Tax=Formosa sp. Hel1_31_208 TaxID=1798225 RepID=UPI00087DA612|nr:phage/plasmid replication protein [Formosa sp. Hel1_31_208]SDR88262.1 hypothetical protein SAMN04515667_0903 [Formosa sp. Hel1_31_208]